MSTANLTAPQFTDENAAREHLEALRWPNGVYCPKCGSFEGITKMQGKSHRPGLFNCNACRKPFSVTVGTVYERSHIPLHKWLLATHLMASSKKGISAHQLHRMLGITYKSAWFMAHRIREAMKADGREPMGGEGKAVEADETFIGRKAGRRKGRGGHAHKNAVLSLVERGGSVRSFHIDKVGAAEIGKIVAKNVKRETTLMTDEGRHYETVGKQFADHQAVEHTRDEYVRGDAHTNTVEGFYSIFKRGMKGIYQHCDERHLHRYLAEFDFRYSNRASVGCTDAERAAKALKGIEGKRLTYRRINERAEETPLG
jgi:transposase-like protein